MKDQFSWHNGSSEHGIATHFIPSSRIPDLKARLSSLEDATPDLIDAAIEELHFERSTDEAPPELIGKTRVALDAAFSGKTAEDIVATLTDVARENDDTGKWAAATLGNIHMRSPTSVKVALGAIRRAKNMTLGEVLQMEMSLATAFIVLFLQLLSRIATYFTHRTEPAKISSLELPQC